MIQYKVVTGGAPPSQAECDLQWQEGYELVASTGICCGTGAIPEYTSYFKYTGGNRAARSVIGRGN